MGTPEAPLVADDVQFSIAGNWGPGSGGYTIGCRGGITGMLAAGMGTATVAIGNWVGSIDINLAGIAPAAIGC